MPCLKPTFVLLAAMAAWLPLPRLATAQVPDAAGSFPDPYNSESTGGQPLTPQAALASLRLPAGFQATLFAAEPQVQNPIAATVDARGRVWVAENYTYAEPPQRFDLQLRDRVVVLDDRDGDGQADQRTIFSDNLQMLTGLVVGQGGVWLMCPPQLLFIPDADGDLVPDGPPQVQLDGFTVARENYHNFANGLSWGPDSWLYGRCGASCPGELGLPGAAPEQRVPIRGGIWRFHPQRQVVEVLTQGTTNPWGHDWNALGELFFINTVNGHLWHAIPGAHFVRPHTLDAYPHSYELIDMHADHWHFDTGKSWTDSRHGAANDYGGGHAHVGMLIYQEQRWPAAYHGRLLTVNMHGRRVNQERLEAHGSGYVGRHEPDFLLSDDEWFRGMELLPLPDGNVLLVDWSDTGECHEATGVHRTSGRLFKIHYGQSDNRPDHLAASTASRDPRRLAELQSAAGQWLVRRSREQLRWLAVAGAAADSSEFAAEWDQAAHSLQQLLAEAATPELRLQAVFALWAMERMGSEQLLELLEDEQPAIRSWAIRLLTDHWPLDSTLAARPAAAASQVPDATVIGRFIALAQSEPSASVRLTLASTLQRLPLDARPALAQALMSHAADAEDHNLPLMVWYGVMPLADADNPVAADKQLATLVDLVAASHWPRTRRLISRRVASRMEEVPQATQRLLAVARDHGDGQHARDIVQGLADALAGRRQLSPPAGWEELQAELREQADPQLQTNIAALNVLFGDGVAIEELKRLAGDASLPLERRRTALQSLVDARAPGLRELCLQLLKQRYLNVVAVRGLASEEDPQIATALLGAYRAFAPADRPQVISALASRPSWAQLLLHAVAAGSIDRQEISAFQARQIASLAQPELLQMLADTWGQIRNTSQDRQAEIRRLKQMLTRPAAAAAHPGRGRSLFDQQCAACHTLFGQGGKLGPDLTGAQRNNLDYLLENIVDPSAVVTKEFRATLVELSDGRLLSGLVTARSDQGITLASQVETWNIPQADIVQLRQADVSTMPDGLLTQLSEPQIRDLFAYLQSTQQIAPQ